MRAILSNILKHFWNIAGAVSIQVKVLGIVVGLVVVLSIFVTWQTRRILDDALSHSLQEQGHAVSHTLSNDPDASWDNAQIQSYLEESQAHYSNDLHNTTIDYVIVQNQAGNPTAYTPEEYLDDEFLNRKSNEHIANLTIDKREIIEIVVESEESDLVFRVGFSKGNIEDTVNQVTQRIVILTVLMIGLGLLAATILTRLLTRPILSLVKATKAIEQGNYSIHLTRWANDEIGELTDAFNRMTQSLAEADEVRREQEKLREQYISGVIMAQEAERKRIARELHDSTSQSLTSLLVGLHNFENTITPQQASPIANLKKTVNQILDDVHELARLLRPSVLDDLGLINALERYIEDFNLHHRIKVDFVALGLTERPKDELETTIYRIVQEGLTNISRHAQASTASVLLEDKKDSVHIIVEDNGRGFDPDTIRLQENSLGLQGIRERARLFNGTLTIESKIGQGTSLFIKLFK